ncbi:MAG TPA: hypothetical protein VGK67_03915 [Myxococcales bacterium]
MSFDPKRFARLAAHLEGLPSGLASHPDCKAKGTLVRSFASGVRAEQVRGAGLPEQVEALLLTPPTNSSWVPEVLSWAGIFAVGDLEGLDDAAWAGWVARKNRELYTSAVMRLVMNFTSPTLALALSSAYWGVIHHGSRLQVVDSSGSSARVVLNYPERLFGEPASAALAIAFSVALELSRAHRPVVSLERWTPTQATYEARWA